MKKWKFRAAACLLALQICAGSVTAAQPFRQSSLPLADSLTLSSQVLSGDHLRSENILTYAPGGDVTPMVVYGDRLYGRSTMDELAAYLSGKGYTPVGAVNGAFFDLNSGLPIGMVVTDSVLRINGFERVVGFLPDGSVQIGQPTLEIRGRWGSEEILLHYNQKLVGYNGIVLYSDDYGNATKGDVAGYHVILQAEEAALRLGGEVTATVSDIVEHTKSCPIGENSFVLSLAEEEPFRPYQEAIRSLKPGDTVKFTVSIDEPWQNTVCALGAGDLLVHNGRVQSAFTLDSADRPAARTALGVLADGQVICYTADRGSTSAGMTLQQLAERMLELGCVTAVNLDGGGSVCMGATLPGTDGLTTVNRPSEGKQRACANFLFFVRPTEPSGQAEKLFVYPYDQALLSGAQLQLTALAADGNYMPAALPGSVSWSASSGYVKDGVLTAGSGGVTTVTAYSGALTGQTRIHVVDTPTTMEVLRQDTEQLAQGLLMECGTSVDLTARARYQGMELTASDRSFRWSVTNDAAKVDENGVVTFAETPSSGTLMVSCGGLTVTLPVECRVNPMVDLDGHWAREYISSLYFRDVLKGYENEAGQMEYLPDRSMTRQEFVVAMMRWLGEDLSKYADVELPFADLDQVGDWALEAMQAAYALGYFTGSAGAGGKVYADPGSTVTREAAMTILARTRQLQGDEEALEQFPDGDTVSDWARSSLAAMVDKGIINGMDGMLAPKGNVTRAQVAKMLCAMD